MELCTVNGDRSGELVDMLLGNDVHHAADSIGAIDGRGRSADHFNAFNSPYGRHKDTPGVKPVVDHAFRRILTAAVNEDHGVVGPKPADRDIRCAHLVL